MQVYISIYTYTCEFVFWRLTFRNKNSNVYPVKLVFNRTLTITKQRVIMIVIIFCINNLNFANPLKLSIKKKILNSKLILNF